MNFNTAVFRQRPRGRRIASQPTRVADRLRRRASGGRGG